MDIHFPRADGKEGRGYLAMPDDGEQSPAVVIAPEYWGVNDQIKRTADRLAEEGFRALVVDPFDGKVTKDADEAERWKANLDQKAFVEAAIGGAVRHLKERSPGIRCAVMGFCMGGGLAAAAGALVRELDAAICFYGIPPKNVADPRMIRVPFQAHFGRKDEYWSHQAVHDFEMALKAGGVQYELFHYDAGHAFMNDTRPHHFDPVSARAGWDRALSFLETTIGGHPASGKSTPSQAPIP